MYNKKFKRKSFVFVNKNTKNIFFNFIFNNAKLYKVFRNLIIVIFFFFVIKAQFDVSACSTILNLRTAFPLENYTYSKQK